MEVSVRRKNKKKNERLELVHQTLRQLLEERRQKGKNIGDEEDDKDDLLLSKLLLQLEMLERDAIAEEIRGVRRQNVVTHWLLSALIVVTLVWQLNEVSLLLMAREKLRNPLKAIGDAVKGLVRGCGRRRLQKQPIETKGLPPIPVPDLARAVDLPPLDLDGRR